MIDKQRHSQRRKILARCFTEKALTGVEDYLIEPIETFLQVLYSGANGTNEKGSWKGDMGEWGNYLSFDVMGQLTFGKNFEMLTSTQRRHIPEAMDDFTKRSYIVCYLQFLILAYRSIANSSLGRRKSPDT